MAAIVNNPDVNPRAAKAGGRSNGWGSVWRNDFWGSPMGSIMSHNSYRPVTTMLFRFVFCTDYSDLISSNC